MTASDRESMKRLMERLQNTQAELRIIADRAKSKRADFAVHSLERAIDWIKDEVDG